MNMNDISAVEGGRWASRKNHVHCTTQDDYNDDDVDSGQAEGSSIRHPQKYHQEDPHDGGDRVMYVPSFKRWSVK